MLCSMPLNDLENKLVHNHLPVNTKTSKCKSRVSTCSNSQVSPETATDPCEYPHPGPSHDENMSVSCGLLITSGVSTHNITPMVRKLWSQIHHAVKQH